MKKTYMTPCVQTFEMRLRQHLLEGSITMSSNTASVNEDGEYDNLSRKRHSLWDDED